VQKHKQVEKTYEDGVEVVINHLEPYKIKGEFSQLVLDEEIRIDFEKKEFDGLVFRELGLVEADSEGNIYLVETYKALEYFIYKFDKNGNYLEGLARFGQGPGELQQIYTIQIDNQDRILVSDIGNSKIVEYDNNFNFIIETRVKYGLREIIPLENGNYLARRSSEEGMEYTPPFNSFFIDDENRLYVMTYEKGEGEGEYIHDIFNSGGVFIGRKSIGIFGILGRSLNHRWATAKNRRFYRLINKESGYMELVVYNMKWE